MCVEHQKGGDTGTGTGTGTGTLWLRVESRRTTARWETDEEPADEEGRRSARHKSRAANKAEAGSTAGHYTSVL